MEQTKASLLFADPETPGHEKVITLIMDQDEITWQTILQELVKTEQMDPWDIDVSKITKHYIAVVKKLKELDFRVTGKVVLATAILLKMKSTRLVGEDMDHFDRLMASDEEDFDLFDDDEIYPRNLANDEKPRLIPRMPQPRKRKVSIFDLVEALEQALEVKRRRVLLEIPELKMEIPTKHIDIGERIHSILNRIKHFIHKGGNYVTFSELLPSRSKHDIVHTFIPLLHLTNHRKIDLAQEEHFGEITIYLRPEQELKESVENEAKDAGTTP